MLRLGLFVARGFVRFAFLLNISLSVPGGLGLVFYPGGDRGGISRRRDGLAVICHVRRDGMVCEGGN